MALSFRRLSTSARTLGRAFPSLAWVAPVVVLALVTTRAILRQTGGEPAVPLDDAFIHFEFARSFARLDPLGYGPDGRHVAGMSSVLWPMALAPCHWLGLGGLRIIWVAWALGWISLGLLAWETHRLGRLLLSPQAALGSAAMVFTFGGYVWFAASGMEVVPLAWLLMRSARVCAEWGEEARSHATLRARAVVIGYAWLLPLVRPEGALVSGLCTLTLLGFPRGGKRVWSLLALPGALAPMLVARIFGGQWATTTAEVKWLLLNPYSAHVWPTIRYHLELLFSTLLDGRVWSAVFVPQGSRMLAWLALPALVASGWRKHRRWRALCTLAVALGMVLTTTYDSFLVNRLRYLWPFAAAWFVGLGALADEVAALLGRWCSAQASLRLLLAAGFAGALAGHLSYAIDDVAVSADAIHRQQVSLGLWAREELPAGSRIGLNDAGAITYLSGLPTFDVVGLTTPGEGRYWVSGAGSRFEHYERLGRERLPTHFIVYPRWMGLPVLLGTRLTERSVEGATILGDVTKVAYRARYDALGSAELPLDPAGRGEIIDSLDVADLESERAHGYELFYATQVENVALEDDAGRVDGARTNRTLDRFTLKLEPRAKLVLRVGSESPLELTVSVDEKTAGTTLLGGHGPWEEVVVGTPDGLAPGPHTVTVNAPGLGSFTSLHYWCTR